MAILIEIKVHVVLVLGLDTKKIMVFAIKLFIYNHSMLTVWRLEGYALQWL